MNKHEAQCILKARDALLQNDNSEAYHWLYQIASPNFDKESEEVWTDVEKKAKSNQDGQAERMFSWVRITEKHTNLPEDNDCCLWAKFPVEEPPYCGSLLDVDFPKPFYFTHFMVLRNEFFMLPNGQAERGNDY